MKLGWFGSCLVVGLLVAVIGATGCGEQGGGASSGTAPSGDAGEASDAVDFALPNVDGAEVTLSEHRGKVVIVDFWATWCPPCLFQVPELNKLHEAHARAGDLAVLGVSVDVDGVEVVRPWVEENQVAYTIVLGDEQLAREFGALGFPTMAVLRANGSIHSLHVGLVEYDELEELVAAAQAP